MAVTLIIDGSFFSYKTLHGERASNKELTMETNYHYMQFEYLMIRNLLSTLRSFKHDKNNLIDNVILCFDSNSWRYKKTPHKPYYIDENIPLKYKENREERKVKSDVDHVGFKEAQRDFAKMISGFIPTLKVDGMEADDLIFMVTDELKKDKNNEVIILATDGDMEQLICDNVHFFKDVRKKTAPVGELYLSEKNFNLLFQNTIHRTVTSTAQLFENLTSGKDIVSESSKRNFLRGLNSVQTTGDVFRLVNRSPNQQTFIEQKYRTMFLKNICGDKKDNIFPLFRWKSSTGTRDYSVTEKHVLKALKNCLYDEKPDTFFKDLMQIDNEIQARENVELFQFIISLLNETKQDGVAKEIFRHLIHNINLNSLDKRFIPRIYQSWFYDAYNELIKTPLNIDKLSDDLMKKDIGQHNISSGNILTQSLPDLKGIKSNIDIKTLHEKQEQKQELKQEQTNGLDFTNLLK